MKDKDDSLFVAIPEIADNPRYGWQIVSKTSFRTEKIANGIIHDIEEMLQTKQDDDYIECYLADGMIGCSHLKNAKCDHICHLVGKKHE